LTLNSRHTATAIQRFFIRRARRLVFMLLAC
jgi:hypothetical protein